MNMLAHAVTTTSSNDVTSAGGLLAAGFLGFMVLMFLLALASTIFWIVMIIDVARREFPHPNDKTLWLVVVIIFGFIGALIYFFTAHQTGRIPDQSSGSRLGSNPPPLASEGDPESELTEPVTALVTQSRSNPKLTTPKITPHKINR